MNTNTELRLYLYLLVCRYQVYLISLLVIAICAALCSVFVNYQIKEIINAITKNPHRDMTTILLLFILYKMIYHGMFFLGRLFDIKYKPLILIEVIKDLYTRTMGHSLYWFDSHLSGEIASKITDFQDGILNLIMVLYRSLVNIAIITIGTIFLFRINFMPALVLISFIIIYIPVLSILIKKQMYLQEKCVKARQEAIGIINDSITNVFNIKIVGNLLTELTMKLFPSLDKWKVLDKKTRQYDAYYVDMADTILITIMGAVQIYLLSYLYKNGQITAGDFAFIAIMTLNIHRELENLLENVLFTINPRIATIISSYYFISSASEVSDIENAILLSNINGDIRYERVTFGYNSESNIFINLDLHIRSGEKVGIVGISGAGKSTLIKCLLRYFNLQNGRILIDGYDISQVTQESLMANISIIPQDITMFHRTILENLQLTKNNTTLEEIHEACKKAMIHDDIEKMPKGYYSIVGERGVKISGGQRQRIAIARAILKNAPVLILDEATSALDTPTEILIQRSIDTLLKANNATTIVIAHRLSTLLCMDRIIVLEQGTIVADGKHNDLLINCALYKKLWEMQAGGFLSKRPSC